MIAILLLSFFLSFFLSAVVLAGKRCSHFKPDRSHHCSQCNACVMRMDHHCPYLDNCVGQHNYKYDDFTIRNNKQQLTSICREHCLRRRRRRRKKKKKILHKRKC
eukprot:jgi/Bigna1/44384/e_gw1.94.57.1